MKKFCFGIICMMLLLVCTCTSSQANQSKVTDAPVSYRSATLLRLTARAEAQTQQLMHTSILDDSIITQRVVTYEFDIRSGALRYISRYTPEKQPGNLPHAWWQGNAPIVIRVKNRSLFIRLPEGGEVASHIVRQISAAK